MVPLIETLYPSDGIWKGGQKGMSKGGFMKDAVILCAITLVAGACLGGVYEMTKDPIAAANQAAKEAAYRTYSRMRLVLRLQTLQTSFRQQMKLSQPSDMATCLWMKPLRQPMLPVAVRRLRSYRYFQ